MSKAKLLRVYNRSYSGKLVGDWFCRKTDEKPIENVGDGSELREIDPETRALTIYYFNEAAENDADKWVPVAYVAYGGPEPSNGSAEVTP